jgi:sugar phosphate permease
MTRVDEVKDHHRSWMPAFFRPPVAKHQISNPAEIQTRYAFYRPRILFWSTVGYGTFYFVRKNLSVAMPVMLTQLHLQKTDLGLILTLHGVLYGISKFLNGIAADRANARIFMATALILCAILNLCFGLSTSLLFLGIFWMLNGWFQGMGYPPCARLLTHWFNPRELASKMSIWNISHSLGGATIVILCAALLQHFHYWQICFYVPAAIAIAMAGLLLLNLRDTPESIGLPGVEDTTMPPIHGTWFCGIVFIGMVAFSSYMRYIGHWSSNFELIVIGITAAMMGMILANLRDVPDSAQTPAQNEAADVHPRLQESHEAGQSPAQFKQFLWQQVFTNKYIWLVSIANFFVYTIRFAIFDWGPTLLHEYKGMPLLDAASVVAGFEVAGLFGMLITGWLTDRFFGGRGVPLCLLSMLLCGVSILLFWKVAGHNMWLNTALLAAAGFFIYGPQALLAVVAVNLATKKAAATAVGLTSIFGYASTVLSGYGMGWLVQNYGWAPAFACLIAAALLGACLFAAALPAGVHGYKDSEFT